MPRVLQRTPDWLISPSPGFELFSAKASKTDTNAGNKQQSFNGPSRTISHGRGGEIFVAQGNEVRWADLNMLKEGSGRQRGSMNSSMRSSQSSGSAYKLLKVSGVGQIRQLVISPNKDYLAVVRSHTVHIFFIPDRKYLYSDTAPIKTKSYQLGPTCHVLEQSPVVSVLWHPLGEQGRCLVTITADSVIRLWEINPKNQSSFGEPSTSVDLKKLANVTSAEQDFNASKYGSGKAFTPDSIELEPAAACFGGGAEEGEYPWRSMTLWIAMKGGEIYALCPLLPKRWQTYPGLRDNLALTVSANDIESDEADNANLGMIASQNEFVENMQSQQPFIVSGALEFDTAHVYSRPDTLSAAPRLQGPFEMDPEMDEDDDVTDLLVVGIGSSELEEDEAQSSTSVICLLTKSGHLHMYLDLEGIEGQWLPLRSATTPFSTPRKPVSQEFNDYRTLLSFETIKFDVSSTTTYPSFTRDVCSPYAFFVTTSAGVHYVSMSNWLLKIDHEIGDPAEGAAVRLEAPLQSAHSLVEHPINLRQKKGDPVNNDEVTSCIILADSSRDPDLGYLLLTTQSSQPYAAQLDIADKELHLLSSDSPSQRSTSPARALLLHEPREVYRPDPRFNNPSSLPHFIATQSRHGLREEVRLSNATLQTLTGAHKIMSAETHFIGEAASQLFTQCRRLAEEFKDQIAKVRDMKQRIEGLTGEDEGGASGEDEGEDRPKGTKMLMQRLDDAVERQARILARHEELKKRLAKASARDLSDREKAWIAEVDRLTKTIPDRDVETRDEVPLMRRFDDVKHLGEELAKQAKRIEGGDSGDGKGKGKEENGGVSGGGLVKVPQGFRKERVVGVMQMLDRESALVEATVERLGRLSVGH
ncbi:hypothetical protein EJ08DRAFT_649346 [Tothia fuscella]|uniref:Uncharacterized protein n=1 Tax=Tothia fuscella TaxID=1048955 RepID=A0A9P4NSA8_9PEZI|nr:hypothetical protein EJ08DRAFT_649346 [Tothia fuscella]